MGTRTILFSGLVLAATFIVVHKCGGRTIDHTQVMWLTGASPSIVRHKRALPPREKMENSTLLDVFTHGVEEDLCGEVRVCHYDELNFKFMKTLQEFRFGDIYDNLELWCESHEECWDERCNEAYLKTAIAQDEELYHWVCEHPANFRNITCTEETFSTQMSACADRHFRDYSIRSTIAERARAFKGCIISTLYDFDGCSDNEKRFLESLFNYILLVKYGVE